MSRYLFATSFFIILYYGTLYADVASPGKSESVDYSKMVRIYSKAIKKDSTNAHLYFLRGIAFQNSNTFKPALLDFNKVISLSPNHQSAYLKKGEVEYALSNFDDAITSFTQYLALGHKSTVDSTLYETTYLFRGICYHNTADYISSIADLSMAIKRNRANATTYYYRAIAKSKLGHFRGALSDLSEAITLDATYTDAYMLRGSIHTQADDYYSAIDNYTSVISQQPEHAAAYYFRGMAWVVYFRNFEKGIADLLKANKLGDPRAEQAVIDAHSLKHAVAVPK